MPYRAYDIKRKNNCNNMSADKVTLEVENLKDFLTEKDAMGSVFSEEAFNTAFIKSVVLLDAKSTLENARFLGEPLSNHYYFFPIKEEVLPDLIVKFWQKQKEMHDFVFIFEY